MKKFFRSFLVLIEMIIFALGALKIGLVIFPIVSLFKKGTKRRECFANIVQEAWQLFILIMVKTNVIKINIKGNLSEINGKIVVASHPSFIDIILLIGSMPKSLCLAKKELLKNPIMRNIVKSLYIVNDIDIDLFIKNSTEALNDGYNIIIFPTGTRTKVGEKIKIHKGAAQIAIASKMDIIPIKITTDYPFLCKNSYPLDAGSNPINYNIEIQPAININEFLAQGLDDIKLRNHISEQIKEAIN